MLVRWQYWQASAKMYADHPLTGVGPGNFATFYTRYKPAAALESVADPHNFPLSILTQYGTLGLIGFLAMIFIPLWRIILFSHEATESQRNLPDGSQGYKLKKTWCLCAFVAKRDNLALLIIISLALLFVRTLLMPLPPADNIDVVIYLILTLYITPAAIFIIAFLLLTGPLQTMRNTIHDSRTTNHEPLPAIALIHKAEAGRVTALAAVLFSAIAGVILHNLIDFAIFEPPVLTTFWAIMACLIAADSYHNIATAACPETQSPCENTIDDSRHNNNLGLSIFRSHSRSQDHCKNQTSQPGHLRRPDSTTPISG